MIFFPLSGKALFPEWVMSLYYWDYVRAQHFHSSVCIETDCPCKVLVQNVTQAVESFWGTTQYLNSHNSVRCTQWEEPEGSLLKVTKYRACRQLAIPDPTREEGMIWCWDQSQFSISHFKADLMALLKIANMY